MKILVACEESQEVTKELRKLGHEAYSCDIIPCSGGHLEWHIMQDVLPLLNGNCSFKTCDGLEHTIYGKWDMIIAFPPCTHLAVSGAPHFEKKRSDGRQRIGIEFFSNFLNADCEKIAIENPVGIISGGDYIKEHFPDLAEKYEDLGLVLYLYNGNSKAWHNAEHGNLSEYAAKILYRAEIVERIHGK